MLRQQAACQRYKGVCFHDAASDKWVVLDQRGRQLSLEQSPVPADDCFTLYDDAHCRGSDLKLRQTAVGMLTLAPGIAKDKLMQAAGRLRQLGRGQTLVLVGLPDVTDKVVAASSGAQQQGSGAASSAAGSRAQPSMQAVLQWVMGNTVTATLGGVLEWAGQGIHFAVTKGAPDRALLPEKLQLRDFFGGAKAREPMAAVVKAAADDARRQLQKHAGTAAGSASSASASGSNGSAGSAGFGTAEREALVAKVQKLAGKLGRGHQVVAGQGADQECEREIEQEEEEEEERELQPPRVLAAAECDWRYAAAFGARAPSQLAAAAGGGLRLLSLPQLAAQLGGGCEAFPWSAKVLCTHNFVHAVVADVEWPPSNGDSEDGGDGAPAAAAGQYLRCLDALLLFAGGEVLLLSEREADALQALLWQPGPAKGGGKAVQSGDAPLLLSLRYARAAVSGGGSNGSGALLASLLTQHGAPRPPPSELGALLRRRLGDRELVSLLLLDGGANVDTPAQRQALARLARGRTQAAVELLRQRGRLPFFARSDLEVACDDGVVVGGAGR